MARKEMGERGTAVQVPLKTIYVAVAAMAVILGCAVTAFVLLFTAEGRRSRRDGRSEEVRGEPSARPRSRLPPAEPSTAPLARGSAPPPVVTPPVVTPPVVTSPVITLPPPISPVGPGARFVYAPRPVDGLYAELAPIFHDGQLARAIDAVNVYALEHEVTITTDVGERCVGGYDAATHTLTLCVSQTFADLSMQIDAGAQRADAMERARHTTVFLLLRGMGTALAQDLELPTTGRSSDLGDEFAALVLAQNGRAEECGRDVMGLSQTLWPTGVAMSRERLEHVVCLLTGADPKVDVPGVVNDPSGCSAEYRRVDDAWTRLLEPFSRAGSGRGM